MEGWKVLIGIPCLLKGGTETQTLSLVKALSESGHEPIVACYFEFDPEMVRRYEEVGGRVVLQSLRGMGERPKGIYRTAKFLYSGLKEIVKTEKPDMAHVQYMAPGALPILILRALGVKKIFATTHTDANIYGRTGLKLIKLLSKFVLSGFQTITLKAEQNYFGSSSLFNPQKTLLDPKINLKGRHFTIYNTLPSHIKLRENPKFDDQSSPRKQITIGVVSRLEKIKGMDLVVPAFGKVVGFSGSSGEVEIRLLIVGDGSLRNSMEQHVRELPPMLEESRGVVEFTGRKSSNELQDYYDRIDILLMPSRSEGFGLTALEGMARGCVPVVSNTGGLPEVVTRESGVLHNPEDVDDISAKILELIDDPELLSKLSEGAVKRAAEFSFERYKEKIGGWYKGLGGK